VICQATMPIDCPPNDWWQRVSIALVGAPGAPPKSRHLKKRKEALNLRECPCWQMREELAASFLLKKMVPFLDDKLAAPARHDGWLQT